MNIFLATSSLALLLCMAPEGPCLAEEPARRSEQDAPDAGFKAPEPPRCEFAQTRIDFGTIWAGPGVPVIFEFKNTGGSPLRILKVNPGCHCGIADSHSQIVPAGGSGRIELTLKTATYDGRVSRKIDVTTNDPASRIVQLWLEGTVKKLVTIKPEAGAVFGNLPLTKSAKKEVELIAPAGENVKLKLKRPQDAAPFVPELREVKPGQQYLLTVTFPGSDKKGTYNGDVVIETNYTERPTILVKCTARVPDRVEVIPSPVVIALASAKPVTRTISLVNRGEAPLSITSATIDDPNVAVEVEPQKDGKAFRIGLKLPANYLPPTEGRRLLLKTSDPEFAEIAVAVARTSDDDRGHGKTQHPDGGKKAPIELSRETLTFDPSEKGEKTLSLEIRRGSENAPAPRVLSAGVVEDGKLEVKSIAWDEEKYAEIVVMVPDAYRVPEKGLTLLVKTDDPATPEIRVPILEKR